MRALSELVCTLFRDSPDLREVVDRVDAPEAVSAGASSMPRSAGLNLRDRSSAKRFETRTRGCDPL